MRLQIFAFFALVVGVSCGDRTSSGRACPAGQALLDGTCHTVCITNQDCDDGQVCGAQGACIEVDGPPPTILSVDGDSFHEDTSPDHAAHHVTSGLIVTGRDLDDVTVGLEANGPGLSSYANLTVRPGGSSSRFEVELPGDLREGAYRLVVVNAAGADDAGVTILQGEQGIAGSCNPEACTSQALPGFAAAMSIEARGYNGVSGGEQSLRIDGVDQIQTPADGIWLSVLERDTHIASADAAHNRHYDLHVEIGGLIGVLQSLDEGQLAVVVSRGDLSSFVDVDPGVGSTLSAELEQLGASDLIHGLEPHESFVLAGHPGIGAGNGVLVVSGTGVAEAAVIVADGNLLGNQSVGWLGRDISSDEIVDGTIEGDDFASGAIASHHLGAGVVTSIAIATNAVGSDELADGTVTTHDIADNTITAADIASAAITTSKLASGAVDASAIAANAVTSSHLAYGSVDSSHLVNSCVTTDAIATGAVRSSDIADGSITAADIGTGAVDTSKIADDTITSADIGPAAVGASELASASVSNDKLDLAISTGIVPYNVGWNGTTEHCGDWVAHNFCALSKVQNHSYVNNGTNVWCVVRTDGAGRWQVCARGNNTTWADCTMMCF